MHLKKAFFYCITVFLLLTTLSVQLRAQKGSTITLDKPAQYENKTLGAEKTANKKFNTSRHIYQNMVTHYNYFFNANTKLNAVLDKARQAMIYDYSRLLPYYNYSLDATSQDKTELDSIIYKCTAGVLLHNLNNDWIDDIYLLLGKAYFLRKDFDSANQVFRYMNYAFAPKDDGYDIPIGSNASNTNGEFTIATNEKRNLWQKLTTHRPERNNAFLWLVRSYIENKKMNEAAGLLEILKADPQFPQRLRADLHEVTGYWFYTQQVYDSAAVQLSYTLSNTSGSQEKARREYLIGQLYLLAGNEDKASAAFIDAAKHTIDPVLEAYATLNSIKLRTNKDDAVFLQQKLNKLLQLARKEKYALYRDVIYYAAAQVAIDLKRPDEAKKYLIKSVTGAPNPAQRSASFLLLGDINYDTKDYVAAHNAYDSIDNSQLSKPADQERIEQRKPSLTIIAGNVTTIIKEDSLQHIAGLPATEREAEVRKIVKRLRKQQGLKEDDNSAAFINPAVRNVAPATLFSETSGSASDWYFNNVSLKSSGVADFNTRWGKRPNVDNWRRSAAIDPMTRNQAQVAEEVNKARKDSAAATADTLSFDALMNRLPLTPAAIATSDEKIMQALLINAKTFQSELQDYPTAIDTYKELLRRFPETTLTEEVLFNLSYCYRRLGDTRRQDSVKTVLQSHFPKSKWTQLANRSEGPVTVEKDAATQLYEQVYNLFLEGNFELAKQQKLHADSLYGKNNWSPQLLYIEAVYYIKQREDSTAIQKLTDLKQLYASSPLAEKAATMIDVLRRRAEIESYLTNLQVTRADEETMPILADASTLRTVPNAALITRTDTVVTTMAIPRTIEVKKDTVPTVTVKKFSYDPEAAHFVVLFLSKVDPVYVNEARNAFSRYNQQYFYAEKITTTINKLDDSTQLVLMGPFPKAALALDYIDKTRPQTRSRILPWLTPQKYEFGIISPDNLNLLQQDKDLATYRELLKQALPGKF